LLDFGIAKQLESLDVGADQTQTGVRLMTPAYAAPEQFTGGRQGTHTDIYSLGVILYELLTGRLPFDLSDRTPAEATTLILEQPPEKPSVAARSAEPQRRRVRRRVVAGASWADLDVLCLTAMHKDPQRRYRTVDALVRDIDHFLAGEPLEACPDTMGYRLGKFVRRNRSQVAASSMAAALVVGLVVFYTVRLAGARNAALAQAARTERIQQFMMQLFEGGDEGAGPADTLRVVTLVDRGVDQARGLDVEPLVQAELFQTLGSIYAKMGHLDRADTLLRSSLDRRRALLGPEHADVASSLVALGMLRDAQAKYDDAERLVRAGLDMSTRDLGANSAATARATASLGQVLEDRGAYERAIPVLEDAVRLQTRLSTAPPDLRPSLTELANTHFYAGHYAVSDSINRRVLAMDRSYYGEHHPNVADDLINLGANQYEWGRYAEAERYDRQGLAITQAYYGKDHPATASAYSMLARALVSEGHDVEAEAMLSEALGIQERVFGPVHPHVASTLNELGRVAQHEGKLDGAEADFQRMADIYKEVYHDKHYLIGIALSNLAGVHQARKDYARAEAIFREVLRRYGEVLSPDHQLVGIAHVRLGQVIAMEQRYAEAERESRAGYQILVRQVDPGSRWVQTARTDLVREYDALQEPDTAARFRAEMAKYTGPAPSGGAPK
jgi:serine/threonine-protein kinase